jgi:hypothetical protein
VLVPIEEWQRLQKKSRPNLKELLLLGPRFENISPKRGRWKRHLSEDFSGPDFK